MLYCALIGYIHYEAPLEEQNFATLIEFLNAMEVREDDETFQNPVDQMFEALKKKKPNHFAVRQYAKFKLAAGKIERIPLTGQVAAISMGVVDGNTLLDLDYSEDSHAEVDMNLVATDTGEMIELQGTGEQAPFDRKRLNALLDLGDKGIAELIELQRQALA